MSLLEHAVAGDLEPLRFQHTVPIQNQTRTRCGRPAPSADDRPVPWRCSRCYATAWVARPGFVLRCPDCLEHTRAPLVSQLPRCPVCFP
jgi:hypothetical protein